MDIYAYNSKVYYIISQGAGLGDRLLRMPITGNETVLDAIAQTNGLSQVSSKKIWIARPTPNGCDQILPVSWDAITRGATTATNYQILPGDRVYIAEDKLHRVQQFHEQAVLAGRASVRVHHLGRRVDRANQAPQSTARQRPVIVRSPWADTAPLGRPAG